MTKAGAESEQAEVVELARLDALVDLLRSGLRIQMAVSLCILALGLAIGDRDATVGAAAIALATPWLLLALRAGHVKHAMIGSVCVLLGSGCFVVISGSGIHDVGVIIFAAALVLSALLLDRRNSIIFSILTLATVASIGLAEIGGLFQPRNSPPGSASDLAILLAVFAAMAWLMQTLSQGLFRGLRDAYTSEQKYREIFNATTEGILLFDSDGVIVDANERATAMSGYAPEDLIGASARDFFVDEEPGAQQLALREAAERKRRAVTEGPQVFELRARQKDGGYRWIEVSLRAATVGGEARIVTTARDISERRAMAEQVLASERLGAIGQLAGGVAHDFNNQLTVILAHANLLELQLADDPQALERLSAIVRCSERSADLTRQLLAFARRGQNVREVVDIDALVQEVVSLLGRSIDKRIDLVIEPAKGGRAHVVGDPSPLQNAVLNLGLNARDAMPDGGKLRFEIELVDRSALGKESADQIEGDVARFVRVRVIDTGIGMAPGVAARVFEPFYTTKSDGNGMGLAATYGTIRAHGGAISVRSEPGRGSTFEVVLPMSEQDTAAQSDDPLVGEPLNLRVLLAEDEEPVARATIECLHSLGCTVTRCADGQAALETFEADPDGFDVVMLDHGMPRMTGSELAERIRRARPSLPIVATSGFGDRGQDGENWVQSIPLPKPYDVARLRAALDEASSGQRATDGD